MIICLGMDRYPQGVDLAYLHIGITRVFLWAFRFEYLYFFWEGELVTAAVCLGLSNKCRIFKCFMFSTVFLGPVSFTGYFSKHSSSLLSSLT